SDDYMFQGLTFLDAKRGAAISSSEVFSTTDGGVNWNLQPLPFGGLRAVAYLTSGNLVLMGAAIIYTVSKENCAYELSTNLLSPDSGSANLPLSQSTVT